MRGRWTALAQPSAAQWMNQMQDRPNNQQFKDAVRAFHRQVSAQWAELRVEHIAIQREGRTESELFEAINRAYGVLLSMNELATRALHSGQDPELASEALALIGHDLAVPIRSAKVCCERLLGEHDGQLLQPLTSFLNQIEHLMSLLPNLVEASTGST
jgi:signal transduction histidine kinase